MQIGLSKCALFLFIYIPHLKLQLYIENKDKIAVYDSSAFPRGLHSLRRNTNQTQRTNKPRIQTQSTNKLKIHTKGFCSLRLQGAAYCNLAETKTNNNELYVNFLAPLYTICFFLK